MKFSEVEQGFSMEGTFTSKKKLDYFNTLKMWCVDEEDGFKKIDYRMMCIYKVVFGLSTFYDLDMDMLNDEAGDICLTGFLGTYDKCVELGLDAFIFENEKLYEVFDSLELDMEQEVRLSNSLEKVVYNGIEKLIKKIPDLDFKQIEKITKNLGKELSKLSPENTKIIGDVLEQQKVKVGK